MGEEVYFRAGVGMLIQNEHGLVLAAERSAIPGAWQAPQGGLRPNEEPIEAARRELREETGIDWSDVDVIAEHPEWLGYELPADARSEKTARGQTHKWFLLRFHGDHVPRSRDEQREFRDWRWIPMATLIDETWAVRQPIYRRLAESWANFLQPVGDPPSA
jgi:putative (di)nucleoside polyphosphate hydrolase